MDAVSMPSAAESVPHWFQQLALRRRARPVFVERDGDAGQVWKAHGVEAVVERVNRYAVALAALGAEKSDVVAVALPTSLEWECIDKAILTLGGVVAGIEPNAPRAHSDRVLAAVKPRVFIAKSLEQLRDYPADRASDLRFAIAMDLDETTHLNGMTVHPWRKLSERFNSAPALEPPKPHDPAVIVFTSGTTGASKGVLFSHRQLLLALECIVQRFATITPQDRTICWLPMANLFQRMFNLCAIERGMSIYFHPNPITIVEQLKSVRPTVMVGVPKFYKALYRAFRERLRTLPLGAGRRILSALDAAGTAQRLDSARRSGGILLRIAGNRMRAVMGAEIKFLISGSAPCSADVVRFFDALGMPVLEAYGVSENVIPVAVNSPEARSVGTVGKPLNLGDLRFADDGEVLIRGQGLGAPISDSHAGAVDLDSAGWYHTGDLGHLDEHGFLVLSGRKSDVAKLSNGRRVNLSSIEQSLWIMDALDDVVAFAHGRDYVTCAIVPAEARRSRATADDRLVAIGDLVARLQADWPAHQKVRGLLVLPSPLSVEDEELTLSLKVRRQVIEMHHESRLRALDALIHDGSSAGDAGITIIRA